MSNDENEKTQDEDRITTYRHESSMLFIKELIDKKYLWLFKN